MSNKGLYILHSSNKPSQVASSDPSLQSSFPSQKSSSWIQPSPSAQPISAHSAVTGQSKNYTKYCRIKEPNVDLQDCFKRADDMCASRALNVRFFKLCVNCA